MHVWSCKSVSVIDNRALLPHLPLPELEAAYCKLFASLAVTPFKKTYREVVVCVSLFEDTLMCDKSFLVVFYKS